MAFVLALSAGLLAPALVTAGAPQNAADHLLGFQVPVPQAEIGEPARAHVAQTQEAAQLAVRIQQLEEQIRLLTGQVEGLQFQLTQMQTLIERMTEDNEFRFQALEGGAGGKTDAAPQSGGVTPSGEAPQDPGTTAPIGEAPAADEIVIDPTFDAPMDASGEMGESQDPMLRGGTDAELGTLGGEDIGAGRPLDLSLDGGTPVDGDAAAQYQAGYDAIVRGDYAFAEEQFRQFVALYPDDPQAADATNWLGEALIQRGAFDEAADVLLTGFQNYPNSTRAPDLLMKLGVALAGAGEVETACRTFAEVAKRYPDTAPAFKTRLAEELSKAQCPA